MGYFLLDRSNPHGPHFYTSRRGKIKACVVHVTAGLQGLPAGMDSSAEKTAQYAATTDRQVSWHSGSDRDSHLLLLPDAFTAFQCQGYNSTTIGHEISKRDVTWSDEDPVWVAQTLEQAVNCLRPRIIALGIPLRWATKAEVDNAIKHDLPPVGFVDHESLDPTRRKDPGRDFPRSRFLSLFGQPPAHIFPEDDEMYRLINNQDAKDAAGNKIPGGKTYMVGPRYWNWVETQEQANVLHETGFIPSSTPRVISQRQYDVLREILMHSGQDA